VLLIDPDNAGRGVLAERLRLQGFLVSEGADGAEGAVLALEDPPSAVVADLSMPSISGVQLCRLLRSETGTSRVPVILRGAAGRRNHFWAEQAGAFAYVLKGRMGELVRALRRAIDQVRLPEENSDFFVLNSTHELDVRERIATHLDAALFESVIAAEVRRLGTSESFDRLVDLLSQFVSQVTTYRWMAVLRASPERLGVHVNPGARELALKEATRALECSAKIPINTIEDEDAADDDEGPAPVVERIYFGEDAIGVLALAPRAPAHINDPILVRTIAQELGGALRMATLVEHSRSMATTDPLTGLLNRRAFMEQGSREVLRSTRYNDMLSVILLDVDHFKQVNDQRGHAGGDAVLTALAQLLSASVRACDVVARWGGEEFVIALPSTPIEGAIEVAERLRRQVAALKVLDPAGELVPVTASFGVAALTAPEALEALIDRADRAMYSAKSAGRNCVQPQLEIPPTESPPLESRPPAPRSVSPPGPPS
jgi:two-component system cell cycle response regulator